MMHSQRVARRSDGQARQDWDLLRGALPEARGVFISLDTPRTVKAKAEYARAKKLGGLYA